MNLPVEKQALRAALPAASESALDALWAMLTRAGESSKAPFVNLLREGCSPATIQSAMFACRDAMLDAGGLDMPASRDLLRHVDRLGLLLMQVMNGYWRGRVDELQSRLTLAGTELQLAAERNRWSREGYVTLYNYFHEVPIMARVMVHDVRENGFGVERNADLVRVVAAGQHGSFAHIRLSDLHSCMRLEVESCVTRRVNFRYAGVFRTARERRQHIRVFCEDVLHLELLLDTGEPIPATLRDLSQSGLGLMLRDASGLKPNDQIGFRMHISGSEISGQCSVRWLHASEEGVPGRMGAELDMTQALLRRLQGEVARRKTRILNALNRLGVPDSMI